MNVQIQTEEGFILRVFSTMYMDWGVELTHVDGAKFYYNPSGLSVESAGVFWEDSDGNQLDEGVEWSQEDWLEYLAWDVDCWIETYVPEGWVPA